MPVSADVLEQKDHLIAFRRDLHRHPELAWEEERTGQRVREQLQGTGLAVRSLARTGLVAETASIPGRMVLLRVDMDALPIQEESDAPYASDVKGRMHACGHDGHVAMGVTAARILAARPLRGRV